MHQNQQENVLMQNELDRLLNEANIALSAEQKQLLIGYVQLLTKWNKAYNLTSVRDPFQMLSRHILDSIVVSPYLQGKHFIDVGTGPGLPGIPLAIVKPECQFTLLDSFGKRVRFLKQVQFELGLKNIRPVQHRVEDYTNQQFDGVISRAFASLQDMVSWCQHLLNENGRFYAMKGIYPKSEIEDIKMLAIVESVKELDVAGTEGKRHLIILQKNNRN